MAQPKVDASEVFRPTPAREGPVAASVAGLLKLMERHQHELPDALLYAREAADGVHALGDALGPHNVVRDLRLVHRARHDRLPCLYSI